MDKINGRCKYKKKHDNNNSESFGMTVVFENK